VVPESIINEAPSGTSAVGNQARRYPADRLFTAGIDGHAFSKRRLHLVNGKGAPVSLQNLARGGKPGDVAADGLAGNFEPPKQFIDRNRPLFAENAQDLVASLFG
jgi:hypothetical protein